MPLPLTLDLGAVRDGSGQEIPTEGFLTYGPTPDDPEGQITIEGPDAALIAAEIYRLWNSRS